jgi:hypothetical protein
MTVTDDQPVRGSSFNGDGRNALGDLAAAFESEFLARSPRAR